MRAHPLRWLLVGLLLASLAAPAAADAPKDTLVMAKFIDDIITLDPAEVFELSGGEMIANLYDRIMMYEPEDTTKLVGGVAESWSVSDNGRIFTLKIRRGLRFHSGNPVTGQDAAYSLQRVIKLDKTPAFILSQLGWTKDNVGDLVRALDDGTLQLAITKDFAPTFVLNCLSAGVGSVVDMREVQKHEKDGDLGAGWLKTNSAGSGPFRLRQWKANDSITMDAFPGYRHGAPTLKRVVVRHIAEPAAQRLQLEKGDLDMARNITPDQLAALKNHPDIVIGTYPKADLYYMGLNQKHEHLRKPKVRQAIRWLVDYHGMADTFLRGQFKVHQAFWPSGFFAALTDTPFKLDVARARQLLAEAGLPNGFSVKLDHANVAPFMDVAQSVQSTMGRAGITVELVPADSKQVITKYRARNHDLVLLYWSPDYMDPHSNADTFARNPDNADEAKSKPLAWRNAWDIPGLTRKADAAVLERDAEKRKQMYLELQRTIQQDSPFVIMFQSTEQAAMRKSVKHFVSGPTFDTVFYRLVGK
jgi:peptide/nickel transport system substrate-binding protein